MKSFKKIFVLCLLLQFVACSDFLEEKAYSILRPDSIEDNESSAKMMIDGALSTIGGDLYFQWGIWHRVTNFDGDYETGPDWGMKELGTGNWQSYGDMFRLWQGPYLLAERATSAISTIDGMSFDRAKQNHYMGQAYFLRAWAYFNLVQGYGGVPIFRQTVVQGAEPQQPRASVQETYDFIISDLKRAESLMFSKADAEDNTLSRGAAQALLAKVYLTMASGALTGAEVTVKGGPAVISVGGPNDPDEVIAEPATITFAKNVVAGHESMDAQAYFDSARVKARELIDSEEYDLFPTYADVWKKENRFQVEHIWSLHSIANDAVFRNVVSHEFAGSYKTTTGDELQGAVYGMRIHWYELFEDNDQRITEGVNHRWYQWGAWRMYPLKDTARRHEPNPPYGWTPNDEGLTNTGAMRAILRKFEGVSDRNTENSDFAYPFLRFADVLLVYAEAENEVNGPTTEAYGALDRVRTRSGATAALSMTKQQFRSFVLEERARELALEGGRRWDLLRWGIYLQVMNAVDVDENNVIKRREEKHLLFPLPLGELNANKNLGGPNNGQNPGW
jgi:hypothetical protein